MQVTRYFLLLGNGPTVEISGFLHFKFPISNAADEGTCSFTVLLMSVS